MISVVAIIAGLVFLALLAFGIRTRQPQAAVAAVLMLATLFFWYGFAVSGAFGGNQLATLLWLAGALVCMGLACFSAFRAWRRSSGSR
jgi:hypothetical protein